jgi:glycosyltransferase involved in cell wall biosynthesis
MMRNIHALIRLLFDIARNIFTQKEIVLISEGTDWVIHEECLAIQKHLESQKLATVRISTTPLFLRNTIVHFFSENTLVGKNGVKYKKGSNTFVFTWFHISDQDSYRTRFISFLNSAVDRVHTASSITEQKLLRFGLRREKLIRIALDVDLKSFFPLEEKEKKLLRKQLGLPTDTILIGSFQKDGNGWGLGLEPKLIKGPDIFCDAVEEIAKKYPIHIVLTGPARGYVKRRLEQSDIPFSHTYLRNYAEVARYFQAIDIYLICSREEGGPKAILESMATGVPLVSTRVGMAPDIIENEKDGILVDSVNSDVIAEKAIALLSSEQLQENLTKNALEKVQNFSSEIMAQKFYDKIYKPLLKNSSYPNQTKKSPSAEPFILQGKSDKARKVLG